MKVLHVVPSFGFGGMEKIVCSIINGTAKYYHHEILVIYTECEAINWIEQENLRINCLNRPADQLGYIKLLYKKLKEIKPDVMMTYNWGATDAIWLGRILKITRIIHSEHGFNVDEAVSTSVKRNIVRAIVYRMAHELVVVSRELQKLMTDKLFLNKKFVNFIANGINSDLYFSGRQNREDMRRHLGYKDLDFVVGFSGRLDPVKNFEFMLDIFKECVKADNNFRMLIIGDGPEKEKIIQLCVEKNLEASVSLIGRKDHVAPYLGALDAFLLTSVREQMPMTILEAMSLALPVVASKVGEIAQMITHGQDGMIFDLSEPPATFARALLELRHTARRQAIGAAARQRIVAAFQADIMVEKYRQIIARPRRL